MRSIKDERRNMEFFELSNLAFGELVNKGRGGLDNWGAVSGSVGTSTDWTLYSRSELELPFSGVPSWVIGA